MKAKLIPIVASIAFAACAPGAAIAGGDYYGGAVTGTAVPAPIPVAVYDPVWYIRIDGGIGLGSIPDVEESGAEFGAGGHHYRADHTYGSPAEWTRSENDHDGIIGGGIGYRFNENFRVDVTGDYLRGLHADVSGVQRSGLTLNGANVAGYHASELYDNTKANIGAFLVNAYYDLARAGSWTPYVGAGLGVAMTNMSRTAWTRETAHDRTNDVTRELVRKSADSSEREHSLAAMATIGTTYKLSDITDLDLNYRYLYVGGVNSELKLNGHSSTIEIDDSHDHQLRAGLRFNIN
jgi:opacity protein-like surface antigen